MTQRTDTSQFFPKQFTVRGSQFLIICPRVAKKLDLKYEEKRYIEREKERVDVKE